MKLVATAGEAHWQLGITERMIQTRMRTADRLHKEDGLGMKIAMSIAVKSQNTVERVRGYSPMQWALGRNPTWADQLHDADEGDDHVNIAREGSEEFAKRLKISANARKISEEELLRGRIERAQRAKHRKDIIFLPGDTVFAWRLGKNVQGKNKTGVNKGQWYGPATVLGTETNEENGVRRPAAVVWVVVNNRLWRCAPQQLRKASGREVAMEELRQRRPWTFENIVKDIAIGEYADIQGEAEPVAQAPAPEEEEEDDLDDLERPRSDDDMQPDLGNEGMEDVDVRPRMHQKRNAEQPEDQVRRRLRKKTTPEESGGAVDWEVMMAQATASAKKALDHTETGFFSNVEEFPEVVLHIEFPEMDSAKQIRKYLRNPEAFVVTSLRKKRVEVNEKRMTPEERESMNKYG